MKADLLIANGRVVTTRGFSQGPQLGSRLGEVEELSPGYVLISDGRILLVTGSFAEARSLSGSDTREIDARGRLVMPGYVDCHTHLSFAGWRENEFAMRLAGVPYLEILAAGGGILNTVRRTRAATEAELLDNTLAALDAMLLCGTTTVEAKSGYGLTTADELKQLRVLKEARCRHPLDVVPTFMGAHALPPEYSGNRAGYVRLVIEEMLPRVAEEGLAEFCDVFCEDKAFTLDESRAILSAGHGYKLGLRLHADEITPLGGAKLAAELGAVSAEHLIHASRAHLELMAKSGTVAVLLPATAFLLRSEKKAPVKDMLELGVPVAVATDFNPGTSPLVNMQLLQTFACIHYGLTPRQAFAASTINAAHALRRGATIGSLEAGKQADVLVLAAPSLEFIPYHLGVNLVHTVIKGGQIVVTKGALSYGEGGKTQTDPL
ncbi:MAG: Imidazolonepropionase [Firmicutes bacterium]|nr:Imidazolonepropionase [Bacillota bacterium]